MTLKGNAVVLFSVWLQMHAILYTLCSRSYNYDRPPITLQIIHAWQLCFPLYNYFIAKPTYNNKLCIWMHKQPCRTKNTCQTQSGQTQYCFKLSHIYYILQLDILAFCICTYNIGPGMEFAEASNNFIFIHIITKICIHKLLYRSF
jgi:hypothetical protein